MNVKTPTKLLSCVALLSVAGLSPAVNAANFPYNYFEVRVPLSPGGIGAALSQQIHQNAHVIVEAESHFEDDWVIGGGFGFNAPANQFTDITGQVKILSIKNEDNDKALGRVSSELNLGLSAWILPNLETGGKVGVISAHDDLSLMSLHARFHTSDAFSMGAEWRITGIENHILAFSVRYPF